MKERVFYVINLDKQRIGVLSLFLFALFFSIFFLGVSIGKGRMEEANASYIPRKSTPTEETNLTTEKSLNAAATSTETNKSGETAVSLNQEIPMADVGSGTTNPYFAETSTAKDEEEEKKQTQIIDLTKSKEKQTKSLKSEQKLKNLAPNLTTKKNKETNVSKKTDLKQFSIQLGAYSNREVAENFVSKIKNENKGKLKQNPFIVVKNGYYVVQLGKSPNKDLLQNTLKNLNAPKEVKKQAMIIGHSPLF
ncbi:SPOR domain-containing protein [Leptospira sp. 96542]|nr:SPOR domain-containing protein [Leptospira sp. 96542]